MQSKKDKLISEVHSEIENYIGELYWDYRDSLCDKSKEEIAEKGTFEFLNTLRELNVECVWEAERETRKSIVEDHLEELCDVLGLDMEDTVVEDIIEEYFEDAYPCVDFSARDVFRNEFLCCRLILHSNYDCMNSFWFSQGEFYYPDSYFADMIKTLKLCPHGVKELLAKQNITLHGKLHKHKRDNGLVALDKMFVQELMNTTSGANLLTIPIAIDLFDLHKEVEEGKLENVKQVVVPAGANIGLFDACYGGGSTIEMKLRKPLEIDLTRKEFPYWGLELDRGYAIREVYGVGESFFEPVDIR